MNNAKYTSASARLGENNFKPRKLRRGRIQLPETGSDVRDSKPSSCTWGKGGRIQLPETGSDVRYSKPSRCTGWGSLTAA